MRVQEPHSRRPSASSTWPSISTTSWYMGRGSSAKPLLVAEAHSSSSLSVKPCGSSPTEELVSDQCSSPKPCLYRHAALKPLDSREAPPLPLPRPLPLAAAALLASSSVVYSPSLELAGVELLSSALSLARASAGAALETTAGSAGPPTGGP